MVGESAGILSSIGMLICPWQAARVKANAASGVKC